MNRWDVVVVRFVSWSRAGEEVKTSKMSRALALSTSGACRSLKMSLQRCSPIYPGLEQYPLS
jgi:hypothetical protein